jgi:hypothetical protein
MGEHGFVCAKCIVVIPKEWNVYFLMDKQFCSQECRKSYYDTYFL